MTEEEVAEQYRQNQAYSAQEEFRQERPVPVVKLVVQIPEKDQLAEVARRGAFKREEDHQAFLKELGVNQYQSYCHLVPTKGPIEETDAAFRAMTEVRRRRAEKLLAIPYAGRCQIGD